MKEDILKIMGIVVAAFFIVYLVLKMFHIKPLKEGLENQSDSTSIDVNLTGVAGSAANYASGIKSKTVQLQDTILIPKYRSDYENVIINMEDYLSILMLEQVLSFNPNDNLKTTMDRVNAINSLSNGKKSLNEIMTFIDKQ
jgi:hypothetical protein